MTDFYNFFKNLTRIIILYNVLLALKLPLFGQSIPLFVK